MPASKAQLRATTKYKEKNYSRIPLDVQKEYHEYIKGIAKAHNKSVNGLIKEAIEEKLERIDGDPVPNNLIKNLIEWLKKTNHTDKEITDCIKYLGTDERNTADEQ